MKISGKHLVVLASMCGILAATVGLVTNVSGLFFSPIAKEFGILKGSASLMLTICNVSFAMGGLLAPRLMTEKLLKPLVIGATTTLAASTVALSLCPGIVPMYVLSVVRGFSAGCIGFVFVTSVLNRWFIANIGLATSIAMGCSGIAGAIFSPVVGGIINAMGWRAGFVAIAVLTMLLNLPAILFLPCLDPATKGFCALGASEAGAGERADASSGDQKATPIRPVIFMAVIAYALLGSALTALPQHFPGMAESYALGTAVGASMLSFCMIANTMGKIVLGILIDKFGTKVSVLLYAALVAVALALLLLVPSPATVVVASVLYGTCYALATVGITMITREAFGLANYSKTYPVVSLTGNIANAVFSSVVGFMYDFSGGYASTLMMFCIMVAGMAGSVLYVFANARPQESA